MINAEELLKPIAGEKPCGEDLSYDPGFQELETIMKGKPETQFSAAEDPDWKLLNERCLELWPRSKDLRVATALTLAALKADGVPGFREGLALVKGTLEQYWDSFYPQLDPSDGNDPTQRVNIIAALATPMGTFGDPMKILERLAEAPLASSMRMGRFGYSDVLKSETGATNADGSPGPTAEQIEAAFQDTDPDTLGVISQAVTDSLRLAQEIDKLLTEKVGIENAPDLDQLPKQLTEMQKRIAARGGAAAEAPAGGEEAAAGAPGAAAAAGGAKPITGEIQSRQDVVKMIDKMCDYYKKTEPSSPVPYILRRAQRLASMDFMAIIDDMTPDSVKEIQRITGEKPKEE